MEPILISDTARADDSIDEQLLVQAWIAELETLVEELLADDAIAWRSRNDSGANLPQEGDDDERLRRQVSTAP